MEMKRISRFVPFAYVAEDGALDEVACWIGSVGQQIQEWSRHYTYSFRFHYLCGGRFLFSNCSMDTMIFSYHVFGLVMIYFDCSKIKQA